MLRARVEPRGDEPNDVEHRSRLLVMTRHQRNTRDQSHVNKTRTEAGTRWLCIEERNTRQNDVLAYEHRRLIIVTKTAHVMPSPWPPDPGITLNLPCSMKMVLYHEIREIDGVK